MKAYNEGEMERRRGRSNANRITDTGGASRRSTGTTCTRTPHNDDIDIDRYPSWRQHQQTQATTQQRNAASNIGIPTRTRAANAAPDTDASYFVRGTNQRVVVPPEETAGDNNFTQDNDTYSSLTSSQDQTRWNDMIIPDGVSPAGATPTSHLGYDDDYYCNTKNQDKIEEAKAEEEQAVWGGMLIDTDTAASSTTVTDTSSGNPTSNNNKKEANGHNQAGELTEETQQNDSRSDNVTEAGAATAASPPPAATMAGAFAVIGDEVVQRGGEADAFTQVSEVGTAAQYTEENSVLAPNQNDENGSPVAVQAHLVANDSQHEQRIQQLEALVRQQQQQLQQPMAPLVHAEIASAAPEETFNNNEEEMPPPSPPVHEQEQQMERSDKGALRSWIVKNRRNLCIALGLVAVVSVAAVVAIAIPLSNSSGGSPSSSNKKGVASNNSSSTGPPSTSPPPPSEETSIAPTAADTKAPVATSPATANPTEATTRPPTSAPTSLPTTTQLPSLDPTITMSPTGRPWLPVGQELGGKARNDYLGVSVALSRDARVLAAGATQSETGRPGYVIVFEVDNSTGLWMPKGQELVGEDIEDRFGWSVTLNGDGTILAVGAYGNHGGGRDSGHVRVFQHDTNTNRWVQLGTDIDGEAAEDLFGVSVSLSDVGEILAAGADGSDSGRGSVRTFQYDRDNDSWVQLGQTLFGQAAGDQFGDSVSLSSSGAILAVGAINNGVGGRDAGQLSMYQYNSASSKWDPMGSPINGQVDDGWFGSSVSLDDSGLVVAVGAPGAWGDSDFTDERVLVYSYDSATAAWIQLGQMLGSQQPGSNGFGWFMSLSGNGSVLAVGSPHHDANGLENSGKVTIFQYNANKMEWDALGEPLNGKAARNYFGRSVSLSEDGTVVAVGATGRDHNGNRYSGSASVYTLN